jgi:amino acid permease
LAAIAGGGDLSEVRQFKVELRGGRSDRKLLLFSASLMIFVFSLFLPLLSVHTYCENRSVAAVFGFGSIAVLVFLLPGQAASTVRAVASGVGMALCVLAVVLNVAFILHATDLCRHI